MGCVPVILVEDRERANLLELMLASVLERRLAEPRARAHAGAITGVVAIDAGAMRARLAFGAGQVAIRRGDDERAAATIRGTLPAVIDAALGRARVTNVLRGHLHVSGRARVLWHLLGILHGATA